MSPDDGFVWLSTPLCTQNIIRTISMAATFTPQRICNHENDQHQGLVSQRVVTETLMVYL